MTAIALSWRFAAAYWRRPVNVVLLAAVPLAFVTLSAGVLADFSRLLGVTDASSRQLQAATAAWAVAFLVGVGAVSQALSSRSADQRLAIAGMPVGRILTARLVTILGISIIAVVAAVVALAVRDPATVNGRALATLAMFAVTYAGIGTAVGVLVKDEFNASVIVMFVWMFDVFLGPAMNATESITTRFFPTHFSTLYLLDATSSHAGRVPDAFVAVSWALFALGIAALAFRLRIAPLQARKTARVTFRLPRSRTITVARLLFRSYARNVILWPMLVVVPVLFVWLAVKITPAMQIPVQLVDRGTTTISLLGMRDVHAVIMVPIAVAFLSAVAGIFVVDDARVADRRLVLSGLPAPSVAAARGVLVLILVGVICAASIAGMTFDFSPRQLSWFVAANLLTGVVYALLGALAAVLLGRLGAFFAMFVLPFLDIGLAQNVMFAPVAPSWGAWMPAHGTASIIIDASFTNTPDQTALLGLTAAWIAAASLCVLIAFRRKSSTL